MRVGHQRPGDRHRQETSLRHLVPRLLLEPFAPLAPWHRCSARRRRRIDDCFGKFLAQRIFREKRWVRHNRANLLLQTSFVPALEYELRNEVDGTPLRLPERHAEANKILRIHLFLTKSEAN